MPHHCKTERLQVSNPADLARAAHLLRTGHTVAFPTETVYGLGANALNPEAVEKIFTAKQRPHWDPLIVHIADRAQLTQIAQASQQAVRLMDAFWPGPLTLLLPRTAAIPDAVTAGRPLVGIRIPAHPVALELLRQTGLPIAAPSANTFGHTSPTTAQHVLDDLDGRIAAVLDGGPASVGLESTVAEVTPTGPVVYRPGAVSLTMLDQVWGLESSKLYTVESSPSYEPASLPSPGVGIRHYAPRAKVVLIENPSRSTVNLELALISVVDQMQSEQGIVGVMLPDHWNRGSAQHTFAWGPWNDGEILAARLFSGLRALDDAGATTIVCPVPEMPGLGEAIRDRLGKAARTR